VDPTKSAAVVIEVLHHVEGGHHVDGARTGEVVGDPADVDVHLVAEALPAALHGGGRRVDGRDVAELPQHVHHLPGATAHIEKTTTAVVAGTGGQVPAQNRRHNSAPALEPPVLTLDLAELVVERLVHQVSAEPAPWVSATM